MSASQRTKGAQGEREFCGYLRLHGHTAAQRALGQARDGGGDVPVPPILYEVKRRAGLSVRDFLDQAEAAVSQYQHCSIPVVAMREDGRTEWMVLLSAENFLKILGMAQTGRGSL